MGHEIDWATAEFRQGDVTVRVVPSVPFDWELLFTRLAYSTTWPFGQIEIKQSVVRVTQVHERGLGWLYNHLTAAVESTDRAFETQAPAPAPPPERRFAPESDIGSRDGELTERLRRFAGRGGEDTDAAGPRSAAQRGP